MENNRKEELMNIINLKLYPLFQKVNKVHLCCLQGKRNAGDGLISLGEIDYFNSIGVKHNDYYIWDTNLVDVEPNDIIVFSGGGGNLSIWTQLREEYIKIINKYPNKIIFMPYSEPFTEDVSVFDSERITHILRDRATYNLAKDRYKKSETMLCPDMAFYIDMSRFKVRNPTKDLLVLMRTDKEIVDYPKVDGTVEDWVTMDESKRQHRLATPTDTFISSTQIVINQLSEYKSIVSTRLHAVILAYFLGIEVKYMDNNYKKLGNFINTWYLPIKELV